MSMPAVTSFQLAHIDNWKVE